MISLFHGFKIQPSFLTFTWQTIVRLFLDYIQFHQPVLQVLQYEALLVIVTLKCCALLNKVLPIPSVFLSNGPSVFFMIGYFSCVGCSYAHCNQHSGCWGGRKWSSRLASATEWDTISKQTSIIDQQHPSSYYQFNMVFRRRGILGFFQPCLLLLIIIESFLLF